MEQEKAISVCRVRMPVHMRMSRLITVMFVILSYSHIRRLRSNTVSCRLVVAKTSVAGIQDTAHKLAASGMSVGCLHGELGKLERQTILTRFRTGKLRALVGSCCGE